MTVGIGAWCTAGPTIVLASDVRATYGAAPTGPHDQVGKQFPIPPFNCAAVIAGSLTESHEFIGRLVQRLEKKSKKRLPDRQDTMRAIDEARYAVYRPKLDWTMKCNFGMSLAQWQRKHRVPDNINLFDPQAEFYGKLAFRDTPLMLSSIVGGFIGEHTMFFCSQGMRHIQSESSPGVYVIGSGAVHAMRKLNKRGQNSGFGLARTILHVHEAMLAARQEKTVGPPTNYLIITKGKPLGYHLKTGHTLSVQNRPTLWPVLK
jgi:hypothetical protein